MLKARMASMLLTCDEFGQTCITSNARINQLNQLQLQFVGIQKFKSQNQNLRDIDVDLYALDVGSLSEHVNT